MMDFELLYFDGCPSWKAALENLRQVVTEMEWITEIHLVKVNDEAQAAEKEFLGSPSIRYNGIDLWPVQQDEYHLGCRVYPTPQGLKGSPTKEMLRLRLQELAEKSK